MANGKHSAPSAGARVLNALADLLEGLVPARTQARAANAVGAPQPRLTMRSTPEWKNRLSDSQKKYWRELTPRQRAQRVNKMLAARGLAPRKRR